MRLSRRSERPQALLPASAIAPGTQAWIDFIQTTLLHDFQGLPDELIDTLNQRPRKPSVLISEARSLIVGLTTPAEPLAFMVARETAAVALRDLEGLSQAEVGHHLSAVAQAVLGLCVVDHF